MYRPLRLVLRVFEEVRMLSDKIEKGLFFFFSILTILLVLFRLWPFAIVSYLFPLYYIFRIKYSKKQPILISFTIGIFFIILVHVIIRYFYIKFK